MIKVYNILAEFVKDLGDDFIIDVITTSGVAFYYERHRGMKFSIVVAPMFGIEEGYVGLVVTKNTYPYKDNSYRLEDPDLLDNIKSRICHWLCTEGINQDALQCLK